MLQFKYSRICSIQKNCMKEKNLWFYAHAKKWFLYIHIMVLVDKVLNWSKFAQFFICGFLLYTLKGYITSKIVISPSRVLKTGHMFLVFSCP